MGAPLIRTTIDIQITASCDPREAYNRLLMRIIQHSMEHHPRSPVYKDEVLEDLRNTALSVTSLRYLQICVEYYNLHWSRVQQSTLDTQGPCWHGWSEVRDQWLHRLDMIRMDMTPDDDHTIQRWLDIYSNSILPYQNLSMDHE